MKHAIRKRISGGIREKGNETNSKGLAIGPEKRVLLLRGHLGGRPIDKGLSGESNDREERRENAVQDYRPTQPLRWAWKDAEICCC